MCGIVGVVPKSDPLGVQTLAAMLSLLEHRGPDAGRVDLFERIGLGHARLSILDIEGGAQPVATRDRKVALVFNGEVFNLLQLRSELRSHGVEFVGRSEAECLLRLYLCHGVDRFFQKVEGQFAIAIVDQRIEEKVILGRDRFGIRPLFYQYCDEQFAFASEIKAFKGIENHRFAINPKSIIDTFRYWTNLSDTTFFNGVNQLPAGCYLTYAGGKVNVKRYWSWSDQLRTSVSNNSKPDETEFRRQLSNAIDRQRSADVPIACYLSGGIDSAVIVGEMAQKLQSEGRQLSTFSVTFDDTQYDESSAQTLVSDHFKTRHTSLKIKSYEIGEIFPKVIWHSETPLFRTAPAPLFMLSNLVRENGFKVIMTGEGADEVLLGYDIFKETVIRRFWARNEKSKWRGKLFGRLYSHLPQFTNPRFINLLMDGYRPYLVGDNKYYPMLHRWLGSNNFSNYLSEGLLPPKAIHDDWGFLTDIETKSFHNLSDLRRTQVLEHESLLSGYLLSSQGDRMSLANSVEGRYPYLDDTFNAYLSKCPDNHKLRGLKDKHLLRISYAKMLPPGIAHRPKFAYQSPDLRGFIKNGKYLEYVTDSLSAENLAKTNFFNKKNIDLLLKRGLTNSMDRIGYKDNMAFTVILSSVLLHQLFVDGSGKIPLNYDYSVGSVYYDC